MVEAQRLPRGDHSRHLLLKNILDVKLAKSGNAWIIDRMKFDNAWLTGDPGVLFHSDASHERWPRIIMSNWTTLE